MEQLLKIGRNWSLTLKFLIFSSVLYFLYMKMPVIVTGFSELPSLALLFERWYLMLVILLLIPVNLGLEALKWWVTARSFTGLSKKEALKGVLTGLSLGFVTPHGLGDYAGRILQMNSAGRLNTVGGLFYGRLSQLFFTLLFGFLGILCLSENFPQGLKSPILWLTAIGIAGCGFFLRFPRLAVLLMNLPVLNRIETYLGSFYKIPPEDRFRVFLFSGIRYTVFLMQFYVCLSILGVSLTTLIAFSGIAWILLAKSIIPSLNFLNDLGIRTSAALMLFPESPEISMGLVSAGFVVWLVNLFMPAVAGSVLVFGMKIFSS